MNSKPLRSTSQWLVPAVAWLAACVSVPPAGGPVPGPDDPFWNSEPVGQQSAALSELGGCDGLDRALRDAAIGEMRARLRAARNSLIALHAAGCVRTPDSSQLILPGVAQGTTSEVSDDTLADRNSAPFDTSSTNNQVADADEADLVKHDDQYIYLIADGALQIIAAWPPQDAHLVAKLPLPDSPRRLFVEGDRLLVFSSVAMPPSNVVGATVSPVVTPNSGSPCTYGYDCEIRGEPGGTRVDVYDIRDRERPRSVRSLSSSSSFLSARRIGSAVHTMLYRDVAFPLFVPVLPEGYRYYSPCTSSLDPEALRGAFAQLDARNTAFINAASIDRLHGEVLSDPLRSSAADGADAGDECGHFYVSAEAAGLGVLSMMSFDLARDEPPQLSSLISKPGVTYASAEHYYVAVPPASDSPNAQWSAPGMSATSTVHQFELSGASHRYLASGAVRGKLLNQFSLDEYDDHLRVATTTGHVPDPNVRSTVSVMRRSGAELAVVGELDQLAPGEDIRAVRFMGEKGYVVTFKKTDPLFVIDLAEPEHPRAVGELKIPGFSTYMHPLGPDHLLTVGYDADDRGGFALFNGIRLQIFDVSDATAPSLVSAEVIGTRGSASSAATDHLAFSYFEPRKTLALPVTICDGQFGDPSFSGVLFYGVDADKGFELRGRSAHAYAGAAGTTSPTCSNRWSNATSLVKRTLFMDDFAYELSDVRLKVSDTRDLSRPVTEILLR